MTKLSMEDAPFGRFHKYMLVCTLGGPICDGYILGIVAIALTQMSAELSLTATWQGLIASASLVGLFLGAALLGWVTDLVGRRVMYTIDLVTFVAASVLQLWVHEAWQVLVLRLILGIAVGADYPIATTLLAEFIPRKQRGPLLSALVGGWWIGYAAAFIAGYFMAGLGDGAWRWALASSAIPAVVVLLLRLGTPESPMWLASRGRRDEAEAIVAKHIGPEYTLPVEVEDTRERKVSYRAIFTGGYGRRTLFVSLFWIAQVAPSFAIFTFQPEVLAAFDVSDGALGTVVISLFFLVGVIPAIWLVNSWGRRPVLLIGFVVPTLALGLLGVLSKPPAALALVCFVLFAVFNAGASVLQWVYPNELFRTEVRATAVGFSAAMSRIGAAVGTFLLPLSLSAAGVGPTMLIAAAISLLGLLVSIPMAPETRGLTLSESSTVGAVPAGAPRTEEGAR